MTCRHVDAPRWPVLSYEFPDHTNPSSGTWFHSLHATSQALQPMHTVGSVKKPTLTLSRTYVCRRWFVLCVPSPIMSPLEQHSLFSFHRVAAAAFAAPD